MFFSQKLFAEDAGHGTQSKFRDAAARHLYKETGLSGAGEAFL
jgi:hypothetical protein